MRVVSCDAAGAVLFASLQPYVQPLYVLHAVESPLTISPPLHALQPLSLRPIASSCGCAGCVCAVRQGLHAAGFIGGRYTVLLLKSVECDSQQRESRSSWTRSVRSRRLEKGKRRNKKVSPAVTRLAPHFSNNAQSEGFASTHPLRSAPARCRARRGSRTMSART